MQLLATNKLLLRKGIENSSEYFKTHFISISSSWKLKNLSLITYQSKYFIWLFCHRGLQYTGEIKIAAHKITMQGKLLEWTNWRNLNLFSLSYPISLYNKYLEFLVTNISGLICINFKGSRTSHLQSWKWSVVFRKILKIVKRARKAKSVACEPWLWTKFNFFNFYFYWNPNQDRLHLELSGFCDVIWEHILLQPEIWSMMHRWQRFLTF